MEKINAYMTSCNLPPIFADVDDFFRCMRAYDYYWGLRTKMQFVCEEAFARAGLSDFPPVDPEDLIPGRGNDNNFEEQISAFETEKFDRDARQYWTGERINGVNQGEGTLYDSDGNLYMGMLADGKFHGEGILIHASPEMYGARQECFWAGEWKDGFPWNGKGVYFRNGTTFHGFHVPEAIIDGTVEQGQLRKGLIQTYTIKQETDGRYVFCRYSEITDGF